MYRCGVQMTFDWSEYFNLAEKLAGYNVRSVNLEAKLRSSISRAYYSAFCKARNYLRDVVEDTGISSGSEVHIYVRDKYKHSTNRICRKIGDNLDRLRKRRNKVDYEDVVLKLSLMSEISLEYARAVIDALDII